MPRLDLQKDTTYLDGIKKTAKKDKNYQDYLKNFRQDGKYGTKFLGMSRLKCESEISWRKATKVAFLK